MIEDLIAFILIFLLANCILVLAFTMGVVIHVSFDTCREYYQQSRRPGPPAISKQKE